MKLHKTVTAVLLTIILTLSLAPAALADETSPEPSPPETSPTESALVWEDFTDVSGHWAEDFLKKGFSAGQIKGFADKTLRPDDGITTAQIITILTRTLNVEELADISAWGLNPDAWYYEAAAKAAALGILDRVDSKSIDAQMLRQNAFTMLSKAFALCPPIPDLSPLDAFSDADKITAANRPHLAALLEKGIIEGYGGALGVNDGITRAEFVAILYRVPEGSVPTEEIKTVTVSGSNQAATIDGKHRSVVVSGEANHVTLSAGAKIGTLTVSGMGNWLSIVGGEITEINIIGGYNTLVIDSNVGYIIITGRGNNVTGSGRAESLTLNASGCDISLAVTNLTDNSRDYDVDRVLALVSNTYQGDFTLAWAESHDYEDYEKELWINTKGYSSNTEYLLWINLAMQRVNIFEGSSGNWTLTKTCLVGSGAPRTSTPLGVYRTTYKLASGWTTATYSCRPVVGFKDNSGYAFHSRLYYPNSNTLTDDSIGFPVSHGCIRMYDDDINYIYNSIPTGTTVVVH